jgi:hypothetical protein
MQAQEKGKL